MPTVTASWNSETRVPRMRAGEASAMYMGPPTDVSPMPQPTRKRPAIRVETLLATAHSNDATAKTMPAAMFVRRRPLRSASTPATMAETSAPAVTALTTSPSVAYPIGNSFLMYSSAPEMMPAASPKSPPPTAAMVATMPPEHDTSL